jgi:hypothetical protein
MLDKLQNHAEPPYRYRKILSAENSPPTVGFVIGKLKARCDATPLSEPEWLMTGCWIRATNCPFSDAKSRLLYVYTQSDLQLGCSTRVVHEREVELEPGSDVHRWKPKTGLGRRRLP